MSRTASLPCWQDDPDRALFEAAWRQAIDALRAGPPSAFQQLRELGERHRTRGDLRLPAPYAAPKPAAHRGRPLIHNWPHIEQSAAAICRAYFAKNKRAPTWKQLHTALKKKLGKTATPHLKTLQKRVPKIALLMRERNSR